MNVESIFNELGVSAITGVNLLDWLGINPDELSIPQRFSKLQSIIEFLNTFPEDTQRFLINKATRGKQVDKLDHMFEYSLLLQRKSGYENDYNNLQNEKSALPFDIMKQEELNLKEKELQKEIDRLLEEIYIYEK